MVTPIFVSLSPDRPQIPLAELRSGKWETQTLTEPAVGPGDSRLSRFSAGLMYMSAPTNSDFTVLALYKSTDGGQTWQQVGTVSDV